jgi:hypothetical protein
MMLPMMLCHVGRWQIPPDQVNPEGLTDARQYMFEGRNNSRERRVSAGSVALLSAPPPRWPWCWFATIVLWRSNPSFLLPHQEVAIDGAS